MEKLNKFFTHGLVWLCLILFLLGCSDGGGGSHSPGDDETLAVGPVTQVGDLSTTGGTATFPEIAFPENTKVEVVTLDAAPEILQPGVDAIGSGIVFELTFEQFREHRLADEAIELQLRFDVDLVDSAEEVQIGYYHDDTGWMLFPPNEVDMERGIAFFETYHFSIFQAQRITPSQRHTQLAAERAAEDYVRSTAAQASEEQIQQAVATILNDGVGLADNRVIEIVVQGVIAEVVPGGKIANAVYNLDADAFQEATLEQTLTVLAKQATQDGSPVREALGYAGLGASVSGALAEGDAVGVARLLGEEVAGKIPVISQLKALGEVTAAVTEHVVNDLWLDPQIQAAYEAYRDGANQRRGYSVPSRNWEALIEQMPASVIRQIRIKHREAHCLVRDCSALSNQELNAIGDQALEDLRQRFEQRAASEPEVERLAQVYEDIYSSLRLRNILPVSFNQATLMDPHGAMSHDKMLGEVNVMIDLIRRQVGRSQLVSEHDWVNAGAVASQNMLPMDAVVHAIDAWYRSPQSERRGALEQVLKDWGLYIEKENEQAEEHTGPRDISCGWNVDYSSLEWIYEGSEGDIAAAYAYVNRQGQNHGPARGYDSQGRVILEACYYEGELHGYFRGWGEYLYQGNVEFGQTMHARYRHGQPDGMNYWIENFKFFDETEEVWPKPRCLWRQFDRGVLVDSGVQFYGVCSWP